MENTKLQQLTDKLYQQGLEKGRAEADNLVAKAKSEAQKIVADAEALAAKIVADAENKAEDIEKNAMTEISLAGKQAIAKIKPRLRILSWQRAHQRVLRLQIWTQHLSRICCWP